MTTYPQPPGELDALVHGARPYTLRSRLLTALAADRERAADPPEVSAQRVHRRLRLLADNLPPVGELFRDPEQLAVLSECVALADPPLYMAVVNHYVLCLGSVVTLADDPAALGRPWQALATGRTKGVFLVTEVGDASSHLGIRTTARFDPQTREFVLDTPVVGAAKFSGVGGSGVPQSAVVCARLVVDGTARGVFSFLVELTDADGPRPGVQVTRSVDVPSLPLDYALVRFDGVRVPYRQWLRDRARIDADGAFHDPLGGPDARLQRTLSVGQILWATLPSAVATMARQSAVTALRFAAHRRAHGRLAPGASVLEFRNQQHALLGALATSFALTCAGRTAREIWARSRGAAAHGAPARRADGMTFSPWTAVDRPLAVLKAVTVRGAARVAGDCQHRCGLAGFLRPNLLDGYHGFAHAFDTAGGDSQLILLDAGRALAQERGGGAGGAVRPAAVPADHPGWWPAVARSQEGWLREDLHRAVRQGARVGRTGLDLWNPLLDSAHGLGEAYGARLVADAVAAAVEAVHDPELRCVLRPLAALYGAVEARRLAGGLLATGALAPATVRALPAVVDGLCDRLLPHLPLLCEALGAPPGAAPAPLAADDYAAALYDSLDR
ncbi:acyl-CoA dehydrogenase [Streptomyces diastatochromogenes]|uniref:acyl-CoA dehydrogenase family protein n=1 Tax=Streptomyces diastatochromogenes TaxID=42236 RepID=UPI002F26D13E